MGKVKKKKRSGPGPMPKPPGMTLAQAMRLKEQSSAAVIEYAKSTAGLVFAGRHAERLLWEAFVVLADGFGFDKEQMDRFEALMDERTDQYKADTEKGDQDYADEKLRKEASQAIGEELAYFGEKDGLPVNMDLTDEARELVYGGRHRMIQSLAESKGRIY